MLNKRYITEDEMAQCVAGVMPTLEFSPKNRRELINLALEWFADELGVSANVTACKVVASRCLVNWEGVKMSVPKEA